MDTTRFDQFATSLASSNTRRQALKSLAGIISAVAVAGALGADPGEARRRKSRKAQRQKQGFAERQWRWIRFFRAAKASTGHVSCLREGQRASVWQ